MHACMHEICLVLSLRTAKLYLDLGLHAACFQQYMGQEPMLFPCYFPEHKNHRIFCQTNTRYVFVGSRKLREAKTPKTPQKPKTQKLSNKNSLRRGDESQPLAGKKMQTVLLRTPTDAALRWASDPFFFNMFASMFLVFSKFCPSSMSCLFPECVARVPVSLWGSGGWGCVRSTLRLRSQHSNLFYTLHTLHSQLATLHSTLYTSHSTLYTPHSLLYTPHFTLHTLHFPLHTLHFTLHTLHFTLHTLHSTLYTLRSTLYTLLLTPHSSLHTL